jgi:hypothetical protein
LFSSPLGISVQQPYFRRPQDGTVYRGAGDAAPLSRIFHRANPAHNKASTPSMAMSKNHAAAAWRILGELFCPSPIVLTSRPRWMPKGQFFVRHG